MNETSNISKIKGEKIASDLSLINLKKENKLNQDLSYQEYLNNYFSKYQSILIILNQKIEYDEIKSSELAFEIHNLINKKNDLIIELDQIENELHEFGSKYLPTYDAYKNQTFEETIEEIMNHNILLSTEIGKKISEFEGEMLQDAQISLKVLLIIIV